MPRPRARPVRSLVPLPARGSGEVGLWRSSATRSALARSRSPPIGAMRGASRRTMDASAPHGRSGASGKPAGGCRFVGVRSSGLRRRRSRTCPDVPLRLAADSGERGPRAVRSGRWQRVMRPNTTARAPVARGHRSERVGWLGVAQSARDGERGDEVEWTEATEPGSEPREVPSAAGDVPWVGRLWRACRPVGARISRGVPSLDDLAFDRDLPFPIVRDDRRLRSSCPHAEQPPADRRPQAGARARDAARSAGGRASCSRPGLSARPGQGPQAGRRR